MSIEKQRLQQKKHQWHHWGPYLSERSWGTVREDYSPDGDAWNYLSHDMARSKAYRWGEDGIAGISDRYQILNFALALWNGNDAILKERLFGLTPQEGNHGEDVKEYYFYLDNTPTHSYMRYLYKYPHKAFPYADLIRQNQSRHGQGKEYELLDTGIFDENRYFDVFIDYAKASEEDICIRIEAFNRGPDSAMLHILPHLWFRNSWVWGSQRLPEPLIKQNTNRNDCLQLIADDSDAPKLDNLNFNYKLQQRYFYAECGGTAIFTDNETHRSKVYGLPVTDDPAYCKDAFHRYLIDGEQCINLNNEGTKSCIHYQKEIASGSSWVLRFRLSNREIAEPFAAFNIIVKQRQHEADEFYQEIHPPKANEDEKKIQRQALAGLLWTKQTYLFDVKRWMEGDNPLAPPAISRHNIRNQHWKHLNSMRVLSMPDKWEYPWFAAWDLAFHTIPLALVDAQFAKDQLWYLLFEQFQHPNGQIPAYEWEFSDLNPPVHAWAVWRVYNMDRLHNKQADYQFLERCFHKLMLNFTWWVNKVDRNGNNVFEGGFLGLDNITIFDRSDDLPFGCHLEQADATGWMGMFCLNMMRIALELAKNNAVYESLATKFFQHYIYIGAAMKHMGGDDDYNLWDEEDGFFYDVLHFDDNASYQKLKIRSLVGLIPLFAVERLERDWLEPFTTFTTDLDWFLKNRKDVTGYACNRVSNNQNDTHVLTIVDLQQIYRLLQRVWNPNEFRSEFGLRSLSKAHENHPYKLGEHEVNYEPGEAVCKIKGGNSNWRGPIWFPTTFLMIESLRKLSNAYGNSLSIHFDNETVYISEIAEYFADSLIGIFTRNDADKRPVYGENRTFQDDEHWRDYLLFYEYFHGDAGHGLGASHQTGWTGLVATLIDEWRR